MVNINKAPLFFKGRKLSRQLVPLRKMAAENPDLFEWFADEERIDLAAKYFLEIAEKATLSETGANSGLSLTPEAWGEILQLARNVSIALKYCRIYPMPKQRMQVPKELTFGAVAWQGEEDELDEDEPTFDRFNFDAQNLTALAIASTELCRDTAYDIAALLAEQFAYSIGQELDNEILNGDGTRVSGVLTAACGHSVVAAGTAFSTVTGVDLSNALAQIEEGFRRDAIYVFNRTAEHLTHGLSDDTKSPIYSYYPTPRLFGLPSVVAEKISTEDGTGKPFGVVGNFRKFVIGRLMRSSPIDFDPYGLASKNLTRFRVIHSFDFGYNEKAFCRIING